MFTLKMAASRFLFLLLCVFTAEGKVFRMYNGPPPIEVPIGMASSPVLANITQNVDHFNPIDKRTWSMRYFYNDECYVDGGPIFIYFGGEWTISPETLMAGPIYDLACENGGYMFYTEHRFYGESFPTDDLSSENLKYLSIDQALADLAYFITYQKENVEGLQNSPVVAVGCSYSGSLATWIRIKYPHLVDIAYTSGAPLNSKIDFPEYYEAVGESLALASATCPEVIRSAISEIETLFESQEGIETVSTLFTTCDTIDVTEQPRADFFFNVAVYFGARVQYSRPGSIERMCSEIENANGSAVEKVASFIRRRLDGGCMGLYSNFLESHASTNLTSDFYRQWIYQVCTEIGWFQSAESNSQPFGNTFPPTYHYQQCKDLYGSQYDEEVVGSGVERTKIFNGGVTPRVSRLISVHGSADPWRSLGILSDLSPTAIAFYIEGSSHCGDQNTATNEDPEQLRQTRVEIRATVREWLAEIRNDTLFD